MKIGVVMPCINLWSKYTRPCLDSLKSKNELYIVAIDNASTDETSEELGKRVSSNFVHRRNSVNQGCQDSWNWGIRECFEKDCKYVLVINNDVLLHEKSIDLLAERLEKGDEKTVMVTCLNVRGECLLPTSLFEMDPESKKDVPESESPDFSAFMISKKCWTDIGEFDRGFFPAYYEDNDFHLRIKLAGMKAICNPRSLYFHYGSRTQNEALPKPLADSSFGNHYFISKWGGGTTDPKFLSPFNDSKKDVKWTLQQAHEDACSCDVNCHELRARFKRWPSS